ncbi:MAG: 16S rRNA (cytidine(1402)-2'-O)-methyltransferase [Candidatus Levybacteria bacterium]|nr:16S rRNA (cytidine(1402)-2'-O)-methyltransferase [Candidatus Levybacteria bacterium]MBI2420995.1 16S rRNA (cytidine(1402)-2'-O)-methyltransferase [Candidatus Levybacteria bacterium]
MHKGTLYIVATPIGNLQDITIRAIETLKSCEYIVCEDTRVAAKLFRSVGVKGDKMLISYFEHNEDRRIPNILNTLKNGKDVALISDSGTPGISDPGFRLVRECLKEEIRVVSIPGPSALISALVSSGLPTDKFIFLGFLPQKEVNRLKLLKNLKKSLSLVESTVIIYVSPHKVGKTFQSIEEVFGDIEVVIARELTKVFEEVKKDRISNFMSVYEKKNPKGELVVLFSLKSS